MKSLKTRLILLVAGFLIFIWFFDSVLDFFFFYEDTMSFWEISILNPPPHELYIRILMSAIIIVFTIGLAWLLRERLASREQQAYLATLVENSTDAVFAKDLNGYVKTWNRGAENIYGYTAREIIGKHITILIPDSIKEQTLALIERIKRGEEVEHFQTRRLNNNGEEIIISLSLSPIRNLDGEIVGISSIGRDVTSEMKSIEKSDFLNAMLITHLEASESGSLLVDHRGNVAFMSSKFRSMWGLEGQQFMRPHNELLSAVLDTVVDPDRFVRRIDEIYADQQLTVNDELLLRNGKILTRFSAPMINEEGDYLGRLWQYVDVTEDRKLQTKLRESESLYRQLFIYMSDGVIIYEPLENGKDFVIKAVNDAAETITTFDRNSIIGRKVTEAFPGVHDMGLFSMFQQVYESGEPATLDVSQYKDEKISLWAENHVFRLPTGEIVSVFTDVTEQRKAEEALKENAEIYRALFEQNSAAKLLVRQKGEHIVIDGANPAAGRFYGYSQQMLKGLELCRLDTAGHVTTLELFKKVVDEGIDRIVTQHKLASGETREVEMYPAALEIRGEKMLMLNVYDVTEQKKAQMEILKLNEELEHRVFKRTEELEQANAELREFAYVVSHDLKAPLRGINQLSEWLLSDYADKLDEMGREHLNLMMHRAKRMDALIGGILQYSRLGRVKGASQEFDMNEVVVDIIDAVNPDQKHSITIGQKLPVYKGDPVRITQLFQNLLGNAVQHMDKPEGRILVDYEDDGDFWLFSVTDNGPGIDKKYHDKIFQIFQTLKSKEETSSTGIGLTLVKKIVELQGGSISVESEAGSGTTFSFTLPKEGVQDEKS